MRSNCTSSLKWSTNLLEVIAFGPGCFQSLQMLHACTTDGTSDTALEGAPAALKIRWNASVCTCHQRMCNRCNAFLRTCSSLEANDRIAFFKSKVLQSCPPELPTCASESSRCADCRRCMRWRVDPGASSSSSSVASKSIGAEFEDGSKF